MRIPRLPATSLVIICLLRSWYRLSQQVRAVLRLKIISF